jgi:dCMP deaminase
MKENLMMDIATRISMESYDYKTKVGAVIAKGTNILSYGYNGTVAGSDNTMRDSNGKCLDTVIHAEQNAIAKLAKSTLSGEGATMYCTLFPCMNCSLSLIQAGINTVIYLNDYKGNQSEGLLISSGVKIIKLGD